MVWYSHLFQNCPQFIVIHTVKGFGIVNKAEIDVFLELSSFFDDPADVGNLISVSSAFSKSSLNVWKCRPEGRSRGERWAAGEELAAAFGSLVLLYVLGCYRKIALFCLLRTVLSEQIERTRTDLRAAGVEPAAGQDSRCFGSQGPQKPLRKPLFLPA